MKAIVLLLTLFSFSALAGPYVEPHVSYALSGEASESGLTNTANMYTYDTSDMSYGARVGWSLPFIAFGFDYMLSSDEFDMTGPEAQKSALAALGTGTKDTWSGEHMGAFVAVSLPILVRVYGSYYFKSKLEDQEDNSIADKGDLLRGSGMGIGIGFSPLPLLSLNIEYRTFEYDQFYNKNTNITHDLPDAGISTGVVTHDQILIGLSLPLSI